MKRILQSDVVTTGLAIFSMFFGAGNVVFPLALGALSGSMNFYASAGILLTAVIVPFLGLVGMILFEGDFKRFFYRIGKLPGYLAILLIIALIGPFAAMPRCVVLSYTTLQNYLPEGVTLLSFSAVAALIIFAFAYKKSTILEILGKVLSPVLLLALAVIIIKGFISGPAALPGIFSQPIDAFATGLKEGFMTMDLLATVFFSTVVLGILQRNLDSESQKDLKKIASMTFKAGLIGTSLLGIVYVGMSYVASFYGAQLAGVADDALINAVAHKVLGHFGGLVASIAVATACLTTAITLATVFAEFLRHDVFKKSLSYGWCLVITCGITTVFSTLGFDRIKAFLIPVLKLCYPAIFVLAMVNIAYKLFGFKSVKVPVYGTLIATIILSWYGYY